MTNILSIWYPTIGRPGRNTVSSVENIEDVKDKIKSLLFNHYANNLLIEHKNKLWIIEPTDFNEESYTKRQVAYHPLAKQLRSFTTTTTLSTTSLL